MILSFDQYYDKIANLSAPGYTAVEKLRFLNNAQDEFVTEKTFGKNFQPPAFDQNEKRVADIRLLLWTAVHTSLDSTNYGGSIYVPTYYVNPSVRFLLKVEVELSRTNPTITISYLTATKISINDVSKFQSTEFNRTWFKNPVYFNASNGFLFVMVDYYTTLATYGNVRVTHVRKPQAITEVIADYTGVYSINYLSIESHLHQDIVAKAVRHAMGTSGDQRYQIQAVEQQLKTE